MTAYTTYYMKAFTMQNQAEILASIQSAKDIFSEKYKALNLNGGSDQWDRGSLIGGEAGNEGATFVWNRMGDGRLHVQVFNGGTPTRTFFF